MPASKKLERRGVTVRFAPPVREKLSSVAAGEHRTIAGYIEDLVEQDLRRREEDDRVIRVYVAADAPEWTGTVVRGPDETVDEHAERTAILKSLFSG